MKMVMYRYKKTTIVAYRIPSDPRPLSCHPECVDQDFPGEGEAVTASELVLEEDDTLYFPGEYHNCWSDRYIDTTCCGSCGQWFNDDDRLAGVEAVARRTRKS